MIDNLPSHVATKLAPHLYYKKYPFKIEIAHSRHSTTKSWTEWQQCTVAFRKLLLNAKSKFELPEGVRCREEGMKLSVFMTDPKDVLTTIEEFEKVVKDPILKLDFTLDFTLWGMNESQQNIALADAKVEFKKTLYLRKFEWRLEFSGTEDTTSIEEFFDEDGTATVKEPRVSWQRKVVSGERFKLNKGNTWKPSVLYLRNEDDAVAARMMITSKTRIKKVVVVD